MLLFGVEIGKRITINPAKPKLLVILGAGSSIPCGMPSVSQIDARMKCWSREWTSEPTNGDGIDVYNFLWEMAKDYYGQNHYQIRPDYERILGEMTTLASWVSPSPFGNPAIDAIGGVRLPSALERLRDPQDRFAVQKQQAFLFEKLAEHMRGCCRKDFNCLSEFPRYVEFFRRIREHFDIGIYNLNYDTLVSTAWPEAFNGFGESGCFDPLSVAQRRDWGFIYHLHGSVHHCIRKRGSRTQIVWRKSLENEFTDQGIPPFNMAQDFIPIPLTTLVSGGFKLEQILAEPCQTYHSALARHAHEAEAILIIGYGFGDPHVNSAIRNRFILSSGFRQPKAAVLTKSCPQRPRTNIDAVNKFWSYEMRHTLKTSFDPSIYPMNDHRTVAELIESDEFEMDHNRRVAIWHGGFCRAFSATDKVIRSLS